MPPEFVITPRLGDAPGKWLKEQAEQLDRLLDHPLQGPQPIGKSGILEQIGSRLWEAGGLRVQEILGALEKARADEEPLRVVITGADFQHLPWELLYHEHPELGFQIGRAHV